MYKNGGTYQRPGGTYSFVSVKNDADRQAKLVAGYFDTLPEAVEPIAEKLSAVDKRLSEVSAEIEKAEAQHAKQKSR